MINSIEYTIEWFLGADLKFLALDTGIGANMPAYGVNVPQKTGTILQKSDQ